MDTEGLSLSMGRLICNHGGLLRRELETQSGFATVDHFKVCLLDVRSKTGSRVNCSCNETTDDPHAGEKNPQKKTRFAGIAFLSRYSLSGTTLPLIQAIITQLTNIYQRVLMAESQFQRTPYLRPPSLLPSLRQPAPCCSCDSQRMRLTSR